MNRIILTLAVSILMAALCTGETWAAGSADDYWPTWRGPLGSGVSPTGNPPVTWSETQNIQWKVPIPGKGTSSPIVWADRIFLKGKRSLYCISEQ